jgi:hypothetical protein
MKFVQKCSTIGLNHFSICFSNTCVRACAHINYLSFNSPKDVSKSIPPSQWQVWFPFISRVHKRTGHKAPIIVILQRYHRFELVTWRLQWTASKFKFKVEPTARTINPTIQSSFSEGIGEFCGEYEAVGYIAWRVNLALRKFETLRGLKFSTSCSRIPQQSPIPLAEPL